MASAKCAACNKTDYPLESVTALDKVYHKGCFKCSVCNTAVNIKNFKGVEGKIYCATHTPKPTSTAVADSLAVKQALNAPKKASEGLATVQKGTGDKPSVGLDTIATQQALKAPKKVAEGLKTAQKGIGGKPQYAVFGADPNAAGVSSTPDAQAGEEVQQYEEQPAEEQQYEEQPAEEQQYEEQQYEEQPAEQQYEEQQYEEQPAEGYEEQQYEEQQ